MATPDPAPIVDLIEAFRRSKTMFTAVSMGVFDLLETGALPADQIAARTNSSSEGMERLLEACVSLGLLAAANGMFRNTELAGTYLRRSSPHSLAGYIVYSDLALYPMWAHLEDAVREASPRWEQTFGGSATIFEHFFSTPEKMRAFLMGMHGFGVTTSPRVVRAFDLSRFHTLADLGGATGHLAIAAVEAWPKLRAVVFDLPKVIPFSQEQIAASHATGRIQTAAGDFFSDELPAADLFALGRILHDWPEEKIRLLLARIYRSLPRGGALLIAEKLLDEDRAGPVSAHMQSLSMLVCTEGKERSLEEYRELLTAAGFSQVEGKRTGAYLDAILATRS